MGVNPDEEGFRVVFADTAVEIFCEDIELAASLQQVFRYCNGLAEPAVKYTITRPQPNLWLTKRDGQVIRQDMQTLDVLEGLMHDLVAQLITHTRSQAVFHAAGVEQNGRAALLVADSGAGKSSLAGWLITQGFNYLSDEILAWNTEIGLVSGLARPLVLKRGATALWQGWLSAAGMLEQAAPFGNGTLWLDPELIHSAAVCHQAAPGLLLFPRFNRNSDFQFTRLSQAEAVFGLMQHLVNGPSLAGEGFEIAVNLATACPAYRLEYGEFSDNLAGWVRSELNCH
jgi:hypothetical protein